MLQLKTIRLQIATELFVSVDWAVTKNDRKYSAGQHKNLSYK